MNSTQSQPRRTLEHVGNLGDMDFEKVIVRMNRWNKKAINRYKLQNLL